ncbi:site-specific tyrosine recombinase XerC [Nocardia otitidiscaviarum]|uniref:Site-specific tyrosine recombinase XerC n=2 Tax=Nocardia otitidiscaviarum TaxID=1823 RepID=A0A378Y7H6_9NOCA|nr:site-specific integrase [Nocardia otitidiscaviarum]SUA72633.1 site-specific tyrosine recombinase XerC [Nocardia otitidiscaviarum]SUA72693.1 site-specific tyrosine recombinase XerC [Nocardia otitidiscaviarum]
MATVEPYETSKGKRYMVRYRKPDGKPTKKRGFRRKIDAEKFMATVEVQKMTGEYIAPSMGRATIAEVGEAWLPRQVHTKDSWSERVESIWRVHVKPYWGTRQVASITRPEVRDWIAGIDRAPSTIEDIHGVLLAVLDEAVDERRIAANPAAGVSLPRRVPVDHVYLTHDQVATLANECSKGTEIVMLLAYSGMRWGEMAALRPRDVDLDRRRIRIARSASKVNSRSVIGTPKSWEQRTVAIPAEVADLLRPVVTAQKNPTGLIWSREDGTPIRPPTTTHWFTKAVGRCISASVPCGDDGEPTGPAIFPRVTAHQLRHTAASLMISSGAHVKTIQRQLGHKSATMTLDNYGHLFEDDLDEVAGRMGTGFRAAAERCAQNVPTRPKLRVVSA